jgi:hypothetical protein
MAKTAIGFGLVLAVLTAVAALGVFSSGGKPGFVAPGLSNADFNLALEIVLVLGLTFGALLARRGNIEAHRLNQTTWVLVNVALVLFIMLPSMQNAKVTSLEQLKDTQTAIAWIHATVGVLTIAGGVWLVLQMNNVLPARWHVTRWKLLMRLTLAGYWIVALLGVTTYYFWYQT